MSESAVPGVRVGHWTGAHTGVTVVLMPEGTIGSGEVRGGAPATREIALLDPTRAVERVDAIVLSGGSAFGLATADGVMTLLRERGQGFPTAGGVVPIVPAAAVFDLLEGDVRPGSAEGYAAGLDALEPGAVARGRVGAGRGTTIGKWRGRVHAVPGGLGVASATVDAARVAALAVVNAVGDVVAADGRIVAGSTAPPDAPGFPTDEAFEEPANTTLVVVATDADCDKLACYLVAQSGHDGLARAIVPAHSRHDGDVVFAVATGVHAVQLDRLRAVVTDCVAAAIRDAVTAG